MTGDELIHAVWKDRIELVKRAGPFHTLMLRVHPEVYYGLIEAAASQTSPLQAVSFSTGKSHDLYLFNNLVTLDPTIPPGLWIWETTDE